MTTATALPETPARPSTFPTSMRRLSATTAAGGLLGLLVGGIGGRLSMLLLARLNPQVTGRRSDDGFVIGQVTAETFGLVGAATVIGAIGGGVYFVLRGLAFGPRWFRVLSMSLGGGVVVGSMLVHAEGIDFTLEPVWLAIVLFVAIPAVYTALLCLLAERWLQEDAWFLRASIWLALLPLVLWVPVVPALGALLLGIAAVQGVRRTRAGRAAEDSPTWPWVARCALAGVFVLAVLDLLRDTAALT